MNTTHRESVPVDHLTTTTKRRRGAVLLIALIAILLASTIGVTIARTALIHRRQIEREETRMQADWLAEAGLNRAVARLNSDANYTGETWTVAAGDLGGEKNGTVVVTVGPAEDRKDLKSVRVEALYPNTGTYGAKSKRQMLVASSDKTE